MLLPRTRGAEERLLKAMCKENAEKVLQEKDLGNWNC